MGTVLLLNSSRLLKAASWQPLILSKQTHVLFPKRYELTALVSRFT